MCESGMFFLTHVDQSHSNLLMPKRRFTVHDSAEICTVKKTVMHSHEKPQVAYDLLNVFAWSVSVS